MTNGTKAAKRLSQERYYTALDACAKGGMEAVASLPRYQELCSKNPENSLKLAAMDPARFMAQHKCWGDFLARGGSPAEFPVTGLHADFLKRVKQPALCIYLVAEGGKDDVRIAATFAALLALTTLRRECTPSTPYAHCTPACLPRSAATRWLRRTAQKTSGSQPSRRLLRPFRAHLLRRSRPPLLRSKRR